MIHESKDSHLYRAVLFLKVIQDNYQKAWYAPVRYDKTMEDGMFIAGLTLQTGPIGMLLPTALWDLMTQLKAQKLEVAPKLEANSDAETIKRLLQWVSYVHKAGIGTSGFTDFLASLSKTRTQPK